MNFNKLAELLYPNTTKTVEDYLKIYPKRDLEEGAEVTRFAPSPTGYLHFGSFCGATMDKMLAKSSNGVFYFRLEDTDGKRTIEGADKVALEVLKDYDISPCEGLLLEGQVGNYGPYKQSERVEIYNAFAKRLVEIGRAYPCFCSARENKEEILKDREAQFSGDKNIETKDPCRDLTIEEVENHLKNGDIWALRFKSLGKDGETFKFIDVAKGERIMPKNTTDYVIVKSNGVPVYHLGHIVDDTLMHTTTVVRGNEWLGTLPLHIEMFEALNIKPPKYMHTCLIMKKDEKTGNTRKISKRYDPEADMRFYLNQGYPIDAVNRYVMNLINSNYENWALANPTAPLSEYPFNPKNLTTSDPMFDIMKLNDISKTVISLLTTDEVYNNALIWAKNYNENDYKILTENKDMFKAVLSIDRGGERPRKDIICYSDIVKLFDYILPDFSVNLDNESLEYVKGFDSVKAIKFVEDYIKNYKICEDNSAWFNQIKEIALNNNFADNKAYKLAPEQYVGKISDAVQLIRLAITNRLATPELYSIMKAIGQEETIKRLENFINLIKQY
ncbi:MAG: glutamate--tRNA ligase [Clostridia bacterium]|nr:glutamate--tRNA ligase [Clostridia bacterium]